MAHWRGVFEVAWCWSHIILALALVESYPWLFAIGLVFVGARVYGLAVLFHDAQHHTLHRARRVNDLIGHYFLSLPLGTDLQRSRRSHFRHHRDLGKRFDPDYPIYAEGKFSRQSDVGIWPFIRVIVAVAIVAPWWPVALIWIPSLVLAGVFDRVRTYCEHSDPTGSLNSFRSNAIERFFLAPYHMNWHGDHHLKPGVPHYRLPLLDPDPRIQRRGSYIRYLLPHGDAE